MAASHFIEQRGFQRTSGANGAPTLFLVRASAGLGLYDTIYEDPLFAVAEAEKDGIDFLASSVREGLYEDRSVTPPRLVAFLRHPGGVLRLHAARLLHGTI